MFCVVGDAWTGSGEMFWLVSTVITGLLISCGGSRVFVVSSGVADLLLGSMARSTYGIDSVGVTSM